MIGFRKWITPIWLRPLYMHDITNKELERYLNDHLAGSSVAILLISSLAEAMTDPEAIAFFKSLKQSVEDDRQLLEQLISSAGLETSNVLTTAGSIVGKVGFLKFMWDGFEPGRLGLFEALEMLALGVQGKRLLWCALMEISDSHLSWEHVDFAKLLDDATNQRDGVEKWRIKTARQCLRLDDA